ncbi:hypothetical protein BDW71DRAFT_35613 [Aspergillus fruticulosus]
MRPTTLLQLLLPLVSLPTSSLSASHSQQKPPGKDAILLSQVHSLTLRGGGRLTRSRRVSPIPQLNCVGPSKRICNMYEIDSMRCTNAGYGYDEEDVQWTCTASLPSEFKLGSTDVVCEGYRNADDPYVLKGSCGVEYRLLLTELGEQKFGQGSFGEDNWRRSQKQGRKNKDSEPSLTLLGNLVFWGIFLAVFLYIVIGLVGQCLGWRRDQPQPVVVGAGVVAAAVMEDCILEDLLRLTAAAALSTAPVCLDKAGGQGSGPELWPVLDLGMDWEGEARAIAATRRIRESADMDPVEGARRLLPDFRHHQQAQDSVRQGADDRLPRDHDSLAVRLDHVYNAQHD